jgi:hypothetical protein
MEFPADPNRAIGMSICSAAEGEAIFTHVPPLPDPGPSWLPPQQIVPGSQAEPSFELVAAVVREQTNSDGPMTEDTCLQTDLGVYGDELDYLLLAWAARFGVDLSGYLPYFHTGEEGFNLGAWFFPPPYARVPHIPITVGMLRRLAGVGRWAVEYPPHDPPRHRPDIWVNRAIALVVLGAAVVAAVWCLWR